VHDSRAADPHATAGVDRSTATACAGCPPAGAAAASPASGGGGASNGRNGDSGGSAVLAAGSKTAPHTSPLLPIALSLLGVLLVAWVIAQVLERRRAACGGS
jgi:hypothetical protein